MDQRALIIFAKFPHPGEVKTRLGAAVGMAKAASVYRELAEHAFLIGDELLSLGVRIYLFYAPGNDESAIEEWARREFHLAPQQGDSLGDRIKAAFDHTFAAKASRTIIIGTDVPELDAAAILHSFEMLSLHDIVIGPSTDGGYYLLGMNVPTKDIFAGIAWSTPSVYSSTLKRVQGLGLSVCALPGLPDIDTEVDYQQYLARIGRKGQP